MKSDPLMSVRSRPPGVDHVHENAVGDIVRSSALGGPFGHSDVMCGPDRLEVWPASGEERHLSPQVLLHQILTNPIDGVALGVDSHGYEGRSATRITELIVRLAEDIRHYRTDVRAVGVEER